MMTSSNGNIFRVTGHFCGVNSPHKGQWCGAFMFSLICAWINVWVNNREAGDLRRQHAPYDVTVMSPTKVGSVLWAQRPPLYYSSILGCSDVVFHAVLCWTTLYQMFGNGWEAMVQLNIIFPCRYNSTGISVTFKCNLLQRVYLAFFTQDNPVSWDYLLTL